MRFEGGRFYSLPVALPSGPHPLASGFLCRVYPELGCPCPFPALGGEPRWEDDPGRKSTKRSSHLATALAEVLYDLGKEDSLEGSPWATDVVRHKIDY